MSEVYGCSPEEMFEKIKLRYDGYHFASVSDDIYNPYSLLNALGDQQLDNYWFASGTPTFLIHQLQHFKTDIMSFDRLKSALFGLRPADREYEGCTAFALPKRLSDDQGL